MDFEQTYNCQNCGRWFESSQDHKIEVGFCPVCSQRCTFMVIYNFIKRYYSDENLSLMFQEIEKNKKSVSYNRKNALYEVTKFLSKKGLSSIKFILLNGTKKCLMGQKAVNRDKGTNISPLCNRGNVPCLVPSFPDETNSSLSHLSKEGGLSKWF